MKWISFYVIVVIAGILSANLLFSFFANKKKITSSTISPISQTPLEIKKEEIQSSQEKELTKEIPSFILSGILYSDVEKWAIINNRILKEGDSIEGAKVIQIYKDRVELDWKGEEILLRLK